MDDKHREITAQLLNELDQLAHNGLQPYEQRLIDTALWFHRNKDRIPRDDIVKRCEFIETTLDIVLELFALQLRRQQQLEGRPRSSPLWLPTGMRVA